MENLETLRAHRQGIQRLVPILEAVRSVAEIAWRRAERGALPLRRYSTQVRDMFERVLLSLDEAQREAFLGGRSASSPIALLLVTAERGLVGPFNKRLVAYGLEYARTLAGEGRTVRYLCLGTRGIRLLAGAGAPLLYSRSLPSLAIPAYVDVQEMALDLVGLVEQGAFGRLLVVHNAPVQRFQYAPTTRLLLPPDVRSDTSSRPRVVVKPATDTPTLLTHLLTEHLLVGLYQAVLESAISEQLARIYTMRLAVDNAGKLVDRLTLAYNRARRNTITNALLEVVSAYEMMARGEQPRS
ncbi:MAG TPA: F0F1 ATP synthase subunit gamma [bacterium]|nr:F0F1 ATP synthase subunit gamma [bacterium]